MSNTDLTFFAAYGQPVTRVNEPPKSTRTRKSSSKSPSRPSPAPLESQDSNTAWCRIDGQHTERAIPHWPTTKPSSSGSSESVSFDVGSWSPAEAWPADYVVLAAGPESAAEAPPARLDPPHRAVEASVPEAEDSAPPAGRMPVAAPPVAKPYAPQPAPWHAQWEVDEFAWPEELLRLQQEQSEYFRYAGEKLHDACHEGLKTLAVVSSREQEGCTTMAICLARAASAAGARVALLDAHLLRPDLGTKLGLEFSHGWQQALIGSSPLAEAAVVAIDSHLTVLPLSPTHRLGTLNDPRVTMLLREVAATFDLLIIDAGAAWAETTTPFPGHPECPINAALVVRDMRRTTEAETLATAARLKALGIDAVGIAENFTPRPTRHVVAA